MTVDRTLRELESIAEEEPERIDVRSLCRFLGADDPETRTRTQELRESVLENTTDPSLPIDALCELLDDAEGDIRREAVETMTRFGRVWPRRVAAAVAPELDADDARRRGGGAAVLAYGRRGAAVPYAPALITALDDSDDRVAAIAIDGLGNLVDWVPTAVVPAVPRLRRFLDDEWMRTDDGLRLRYSRTDHEAATGDADRERLTNHVPRPFETAQSILETLALTHPVALEPVLPRLRTLVSDPPTATRCDLPARIRTLTRVARADPDAIEPVRSAIERHAKADANPVRVAARNLLSELGADVSEPEPISRPATMASRTRPKQRGDDDRLAGIDQLAITGEIEIDEIVPLLHCELPDVRDTAAWGLECGFDRYVDDINDRASTFLSLLDEPHDCTRTHLLTAIGATVRAYPEAWTPPLLQFTAHDDPTVRESATRLLAGVAARYPALVAPNIERIADRLSDEPAVREGAFLTLANLAEAVPERTVPYVPIAVDALEAHPPAIETLQFLESVTRVRPEAIAAHIDAVMDLLDHLAGPGQLDDRARVSVSGHARVTAADRALEKTFRVCLRVATDSPEAVTAVRPYADRVVGDRYYGNRPALALLAVLDGV